MVTLLTILPPYDASNIIGLFYFMRGGTMTLREQVEERLAKAEVKTTAQLIYENPVLAQIFRLKRELTTDENNALMIALLEGR
jgi:hypothetical protein